MKHSIFLYLQWFHSKCSFICSKIAGPDQWISLKWRNPIEPILISPIWRTKHKTKTVLRIPLKVSSMHLHSNIRGLSIAFIYGFIKYLLFMVECWWIYLNPPHLSIKWIHMILSIRQLRTTFGWMPNTYYIHLYLLHIWCLFMNKKNREIEGHTLRSLHEQYKQTMMMMLGENIFLFIRFSPVSIFRLYNVILFTIIANWGFSGFPDFAPLLRE